MTTSRSRRSHTALSCCLLLLIATAASADAVDTYLRAEMANQRMLLVRDGKVRLDEPVKTYLDDVPAAWSGITLRHLLTHTSGLVRESPAFDGLKVQSRCRSHPRDDG